MRNRYAAGTCYRCGEPVAPREGHFERFRGGWRTQHVNHRQLKQAASESIYAATGSISDPTPAPGVKPKAL